MSWNAAGLLQRFAVYGRFYSENWAGQSFELRSHLEIFEPELGWPKVATAGADLVAVMMNPGASRPRGAIDSAGWAPAVPDRTQYQLMKLAMHAQSAGVSIRHIRVINLSDLRTPKSTELFATLSSLSNDRHSIFCASRRAELTRAMGSVHTPVLCAWGLSKHLHELARKCVEFTAARTVLGLTVNQLSYRHPLPQRADLQAKWLDRLGAQIKTLASGLPGVDATAHKTKRDILLGSPEGCPSG